MINLNELHSESENWVRHANPKAPDDELAAQLKLACLNRDGDYHFFRDDSYVIVFTDADGSLTFYTD